MAELVVMEDRQKSNKYINVLGNQSCPISATFQRRKAAIHTSKLTIEWLEMKKYQVLKWHIKSSDLGLIQNLLGILLQRVYQD